MHLPLDDAPGEMESDHGAPGTDLRRAWIAVWILALFHILSWTDRGVLALLVVPIQQQMDLSDIQLGLIQGFAFSLLFAICGLPIGWLVDRFSRRAIIFGGVIVWSISTVACGTARSFGGLFAGRMGVGGGEASLAPAAFSLMSDLLPREKLASAIGVYYLGGNIGVAVSMVLGGFLLSGLTAAGGVTAPLIGYLHPWQAVFFIVGLPGMVFAFLIFLVKEPPRKARAKEVVGKAEFTGFLWLRRRVLLHHVIGFSLLAVAIFAIQSWTAVYMVRRFHWDPAAIGLTMAAAIGVFSGVANVIAGSVADRMFQRGIKDAYFRLHLIAIVLGVPLLIGAFMAQSPWVFVLLLCFGKGLLTCYGGSAMATLQILAPRHLRGRVAALYLLILALVGSGMGPYITAVITEKVFNDRAMVGFSVLIVVVATSAVAALSLLLGLKPLRTAIAEVERADLAAKSPRLDGAPSGDGLA